MDFVIYRLSTTPVLRRKSCCCSSSSPWCSAAGCSQCLGGGRWNASRRGVEKTHTRTRSSRKGDGRATPFQQRRMPNSAGVKSWRRLTPWDVKGLFPFSWQNST